MVLLLLFFRLDLRSLANQGKVLDPLYGLFDIIPPCIWRLKVPQTLFGIYLIFHDVMDLRGVHTF